MNKISQAYESYAKGAAFDAGEGEAMRLKALRPAFGLSAILTIGLWLMWFFIPNSLSISIMLVANVVIVALATAAERHHAAAYSASSTSRRTKINRLTTEQTNHRKEN